MKRAVKKTLSLLLAVASCMCVACGAASSGAEPSLGEATLINLSNADITPLSSSNSLPCGDISGDGKINSGDTVLLARYLTREDSISEDKISRVDINCDGKVNSSDRAALRKLLSGETAEEDFAIGAGGASISYSTAKKAAQIKLNSSCASVKVNFNNLDFKLSERPYVIIDSDGSAVTVKVTPLLSGMEYGAKANTASETENGIFALKGNRASKLTGFVITFEGKAGNTVYIPEIYICSNLESANWIFKNRITPPTTAKKNLSVNYSQGIAMRFEGMTNDDKNNTNGGMFHDFTNAKWPSITVDENDKLYVVASGARMAHVDPFGETVMVTSTDGGKTFSKPQRINNTIMDDRDAGIVYLGNGRLMATYFTSDTPAYLPGGASYDMLKPYHMGGQAPQWAATWDGHWNPTGGIIGTYLDVLDHINSYNSLYDGYDLSAKAYAVFSDDYGKTWNTEKFSFKNDDYTSAMASMVNNYQLNYPTQSIPVTSAHGPLALSDGTIVYAGKVMDPKDLPMDAMGVYRSCDKGETWEFLSQIPTVAGFEHNNFHELSVTETADGALLCAIRAHNYYHDPETDSDVVMEPLMTVATSMSYDKGLTWTTPEFTGLDGTPPHVVTMDNGDIVMTYSYRNDPRTIRASVSTDGGRTWSNYAKVANNLQNGDDMGYPASAVLSDGTICTVYYGTKTAGGNDGYSSIHITRWKYTLR